MVADLDRTIEPSLSILNEVCDAMVPTEGAGVNFFEYLEEAISQIETALDGK